MLFETSSRTRRVGGMIEMYRRAGRRRAVQRSAGAPREYTATSRGSARSCCRSLYDRAWRTESAAVGTGADRRAEPRGGGNRRPGARILKAHRARSSSARGQRVQPGKMTRIVLLNADGGTARPVGRTYSCPVTRLPDRRRSPYFNTSASRARYAAAAISACARRSRWTSYR